MLIALGIVIVIVIWIWIWIDIWILIEIKLRIRIIIWTRTIIEFDIRIREQIVASITKPIWGSPPTGAHFGSKKGYISGSLFKQADVKLSLVYYKIVSQSRIFTKNHVTR